MNKFYHALKTAFLLGWSIFVVFPFLWALTTSFKDANAVTSGATYIPWVDFEPSTQGWTSLFTTGSQGINIVGPFIDSAAVTLIASLVSLALGTLAAYGLSRFEYRLGFVKNADITFFFISQRIMPPIVLAIPFFLMLKELGALDTIFGLVLVYIALLLPIAVWVMTDFFAGIPKELDEMAMTDGCSPIGAFFRVVLPNSVPGLVVAGMFCLIFGWNDFFFAFTLTFTETQLLPVSIVSLNSSVTPWWSLSAFALISVAPLACVAVIVERYMSRGTMSGAIR
ncbi:MAG: carbohydrate ABC transporter permease [Reinekea forsetii]|jgi:multiple sugar transport system permease protein|uniref:Maltose/maltodextrin transport system permease protein MalG n=1 Tax=Reinekea forsetii TaxID=1336806 RepID=A0A2K8KZT4_9GAMM|nr:MULTISPECIES: carbohydrate ABC transporter permease [Reinekea]ATX77856.1 ABC transporter, permease protein [Reinekea forsetii]MDO7642957.1 carbohydrate ABC transporter permease [Reinekea forsetii]MDO7643258.1 carbohydrate ABC transporter permease [Reinekea forsetii]MDO7672921.1 carbohydrate ABC transporter permease [Reinekea forsetii]